MTQGAAEQATTRQGTSWDAWAAYLSHVKPRSESPCLTCIDAEAPTSGCDEGVRLYGAYRLTRLKPSTLAAG